MDARPDRVFGPRWPISWISLGVAVKLGFAEFELETGARRLMRGNAGVHLTPKAFELLLPKSLGPAK